jgi:cytochrome c556
MERCRRQVVTLGRPFGLPAWSPVGSVHHPSSFGVRSMKSWIMVLAVAVVIPVGAVSFAAFDDEKYDKETVMKTLFQKKSGKFSSVLKKQVEAKSPNWEEIQKTTEDIAKYGKALGQNDPDKGDKESWKKLTGKVKASQKAIGGSCKACHDAHRGQ